LRRRDAGVKTGRDATPRPGRVAPRLRRLPFRRLRARRPLATLAGEAASITPSAEAREDGTVVFEGTCDASGAVPLDARRFAVADDENNVIRIYDAERGGSQSTPWTCRPSSTWGGRARRRREAEVTTTPPRSTSRRPRASVIAPSGSARTRGARR
jgi:hypothetical protein